MTWDISINTYIDQMAPPVILMTGNLSMLPPALLPVDMTAARATQAAIAQIAAREAVRTGGTQVAIEIAAVEASQVARAGFAAQVARTLASSALRTTLGRFNLVVALLWASPVGGAEADQLVEMQHRDLATEAIQEPFSKVVPIGEEQNELPILEPGPEVPASFPSDQWSTDRYEEPDNEGHEEEYKLKSGEKHHVFPQALRGYFQRKGIDIHDYVVSMGVEQHKAIHRADYNNDWRLILTSPWYPYLTKEDVLKIGDYMKEKYGIVGHYESY